MVNYVHPCIAHSENTCAFPTIITWQLIWQQTRRCALVYYSPADWSAWGNLETEFWRAASFDFMILRPSVNRISWPFRNFSIWRSTPTTWCLSMHVCEESGSTTNNIKRCKKGSSWLKCFYKVLTFQWEKKNKLSSKGSLRYIKVWVMNKH